MSSSESGHELQGEGRRPRIYGVGSDSILEEWGSAEPLLQRVVDPETNGRSLDDVLALCQAGYLQLWKVLDWSAAAVTQIQILPRYRSLVIVYLAGDGLEEWKNEFIDAMRWYAQHVGCKHVELCGRPGWSRALRDAGFRNTAVVMQLEV